MADESIEHEPAVAPTAVAPRCGWSIVLLCAGLAMLAPAILLPQLDENHRLMHQKQQLEIDLAHLQRQVEIGEEFVQRLGSDPVLAERLAQRQMNMVRRGTGVLQVPGMPQRTDRSPYSLISTSPPPRLPDFQPPSGGRVIDDYRNVQRRPMLLAAGLLLLAMGLVFGSSLTRGQRE